MSSFIDTLPKDKIQRASTEDEFMKAVHRGSMSFKAFYARLTQDCLLDTYYMRFVAQVLVNAPRSDFKYLVETLEELDESLAWLEKLLKDKRMSITNVKLDDDYKAMQEWFEQLIKNNTNYFVLRIAMYAYGICNYEIWKSVKNHYFRDYFTQWASKHVGDGLDELKQTLDKAALNVSENEKEEARRVWDTVVAFETSPSNMTAD